MPLTDMGRRMSVWQSGFVSSKNRFEAELRDNRELGLKLREIEDGIKLIAGVIPSELAYSHVDTL